MKQGSVQRPDCEKPSCVFFQGFCLQMEKRGRRWDALRSAPWETLAWAKGRSRTRSRRNVGIWSRSLKSTKVQEWKMSWWGWSSGVSRRSCVHATGKAFDTSRLSNYATSNIISSIVYGSRFDYDDPRFINMVNRVNEVIQLVGSAPIQVNPALLWPAAKATPIMNGRILH